MIIPLIVLGTMNWKLLTQNCKLLLMSDIKTIIFDFDGTLADSISLAIRLYNSHLGEFKSLPVQMSELPELRKLGYKKAMKAKNIKARSLPKLIVTLKKEMRESMDEVQPCPGVVGVLKRLKKDGFALGILTSNQTELVNEFLKVHKFPEFDFVVSEKTLFGKEKALRKILKHYELKNSQVIYVGDEPRDVTASRKAIISVIGVSWGLAGRVGFRKNQPDKLVDSADELYESILSLTNL